MRVIAMFAGLSLCLTLPAMAQDFPNNSHVSLRVGQSTILKGVRAGDCATSAAPRWSQVAKKLPKTNLGRFSDGGARTEKSWQCNGRVAARSVRFTATRSGQEQLTILEDPFSITVK